MYPYNIDKPIQKAAREGSLPVPISSDERLLELIVMAMQDEVNDATKYKKMSEETTDEESKDILRSMYLDENRHKVLLNEIYTSLSGNGVPEITTEKVDEKISYTDQLKKNITEEVEGARFYRDLSLMLTDDYLKHILFSILDDEQNHSILNMYLLMK
ncbi:MAG: ferritin-like domain-containing protein [Lachnospiraceae bacterium]|nr:ferritin-like domain-containing protein [Lachnospiraceae bacterium]